jgi:hypothetical protein
MSFHYLGYLVVGCGFTFQVVDEADYGYDGLIFTFNRRGEIENSYMFVQLKASDSVRMSRDKRFVNFRISKKDVDLWQDEPFPVYLVVFDVKKETAYWMYLQKYFKEEGVSAARMKSNTITVKLDARRVVNKEAIKRWREDKSARLAQIGKVSHA